MRGALCEGSLYFQPLPRPISFTFFRALQVKKQLDQKPNLLTHRAGAMAQSKLSHIFDMPATKRRVPGQDGELHRGEPVDGKELGAAWDPTKLDPRLFKAIRIFGSLALEKGGVLSLPCLFTNRALLS